MISTKRPLEITLIEVIDYAESIKEKYPSRELSQVITKLEEAQLWLGKVDSSKMPLIPINDLD